MHPAGTCGVNALNDDGGRRDEQIGQGDFMSEAHAWTHEDSRCDEVESVGDVRKGRHDVHRVVDDEGLPLVTAQRSRGEGPRHLQIPRVLGGDLGQLAVARVRVIAGGHRPLARRPAAWRSDARSGDDLRSRSPGVAGCLLITVATAGERREDDDERAPHWGYQPGTVLAVGDVAGADVVAPSAVAAFLTFFWSTQRIAAKRPPPADTPWIAVALIFADASFARTS